MITFPPFPCRYFLSRLHELQTKSTMDILGFSIDTPVLVSIVVMIVVFLVGCSQGRDTWLFIDFLATAGFGLAWYFIPDIILGLQVSIVSSNSLFLLT